jgi:lipoate-protein ligase A
MSFVGIISDRVTYDFIKKASKNKIKAECININETNIDSLKNIAFETILISDGKIITKRNQESLKNLIRHTKYLIINSDIDINTEILSTEKVNIITYGMNQKSTITTSSIGENEVIVCLQRNIKNCNGVLIEPQEICLKEEKINIEKVYYLLATYAVMQLYQGKNK